MRVGVGVRTEGGKRRCHPAGHGRLASTHLVALDVTEFASHSRVVPRARMLGSWRCSVVCSCRDAVQLWNCPRWLHWKCAAQTVVSPPNCQRMIIVKAQGRSRSKHDVILIGNGSDNDMSTAVIKFRAHANRASHLELPKWTRVSQRINPPGF